MALINCPDCGRSLSDETLRCPDCGFRISRGVDRRTPVDLAYCSRCRVFLPFGVRKCRRCGREPGSGAGRGRLAAGAAVILVILLAFLFSSC